LPPLAVKLLKTLLNKDPSKRPSAAQIAGNPFFDTHTWTLAQKDSKIQVSKALVRFGKMNFMQKRIVSFIANILQGSE